MEILKGFVFDIQRFGTLTLTADSTVSVADMISKIDTTNTWGVATVAADGTVVYSSSATEPTAATTGVIYVHEAAGTWTLTKSDVFAATGTEHLTITVPSTVATLAYAGVKGGTAGIAGIDILDFNSNTTTTMAATNVAQGGTVKDSTGTVALTTAATDSATGAANTVAVSGGKFTFTFAGDAAGAAVAATTSATFNVSDFACAINGAAANGASILGTATYNTSGNLTGATAGTAAANAYTVAGTGTVTMAAIVGTNQVVSIDGWSYTFDKANAAGVVFTTATNTNAGATKVENVASGVTLTVPTTQATMEFGNESFTRSTSATALGITSDGTGISNIATAGTETFTYGVSGQGTYTINDKTIEVSGDETDGVQVTTGASSITTVEDLEAKATLNVKDGSDYLAGVTVYSARGAGNTSLKAAQTIGESDYVIVNGTTFYAGRQGAGISTTNLTLRTSINNFK